MSISVIKNIRNVCYLHCGYNNIRLLENNGINRFNESTSFFNYYHAAVRQVGYVYKTVFHCYIRRTCKTLFHLYVNRFHGAVGQVYTAQLCRSPCTDNQ